MDEIPANSFIVPSLISLLLIWFITKFLRKPTKIKNPPPSPPHLPIIGNLHQLSYLPHYNLQILAKKHGPLMLLYFGSAPVLIVSSAEAAREIMKTHDINFSDRPIFKAHKKCLYDSRDVAFSPYGDYWRQAKSSFVLKLLNNKRVQSFRSINEEETALFEKKIGESSGAVNLSNMFTEFSNDGICRSAFGRKFGESENGKKFLGMIARKFVVIHLGGKWDGSSYVSDCWCGEEILGEIPNLTTLRGIVNKVYGDKIAGSDFKICELVTINGRPSMVNMQTDQSVYNLFKTSESPEIYVYLHSIIPRTTDASERILVGNSSAPRLSGGEFMNLLERVTAHATPIPQPELYDHVRTPNGSNELSSERDTDSNSDSSDDIGSSDGNHTSFENNSDSEGPLLSSQNTPRSSTWSIACEPSTPSTPSTPCSIAKYVPHVNGDPSELTADSIFDNKDDLYEAIGKYHLLNSTEWRVWKSDTGRLTLRCKHHNECAFVFRAIGKSDLWRTTKLTPHTCVVNPELNSPRSLPSKIIGSMYAHKQKDPATAVSPKLIMSELLSNHGLTISYCHAHRSTKRALDIIYGDFEDSFSKLPTYLYQVEQANPGSIMKLEVDESNRFKNVFIAFAASIKGFNKHGRSIVVIDGTHLKNKYKGVVFVAVTHDCNHRIFPLATGITHKENNKSWRWFLKSLKETFDLPLGTLIVSDQHRSILYAMKKVFPLISHGLCHIHLSKAVGKYGATVLGLFKKAAYTYRKAEYDRIMHSISNVGSAKLLRTLENAKPERWSRVHCRVPRYEFMTSNSAESWNKNILWARDKPIVYVLECVREIQQRWFQVRRTDANENKGRLCTRVSDFLAELRTESDKFSVQQITKHKYKVVRGRSSNIVDLAKCYCDCCFFQNEGIPCCHALAAIRHSKFDVNGFVRDCYKACHVVGMWKGSIMPVPEPKDWIPLPPDRQIECLPPPYPKPAGCPRKSRKRGPLEPSSSTRVRKQQCSRCHKPGHNRVNCKEYVPLPDADDAPSCSSSKPRRRRPRKCSVCRDPGHTKRLCPMVVGVTSENSNSE